MNVIDQTLFRKFWTRSQVTSKRPDALDERIRSLCYALNTNRHLTTTWSCSGHTVNEYNKEALEEEIRTGKKPRRLIPADTRWYFTFVVTENGLPVVEKIRGYLMSLPTETVHALRPKISQTQLLNLFTEHDEYYNTWVVDGSFRDNADHIKLLSEVWDGLADVVRVTSTQMELDHE